MEAKNILMSQPCQQLFMNIFERLERRVASGLDFFLEKSRLGKEAALYELGLGNVVLLLIVRSLEQGDAFLTSIVMELAEGFGPLESPFLVDWLLQDYTIEKEVVAEALSQAVNMNNSEVIRVPGPVFRILVNLARKSGIPINVDEDEGANSSRGEEEAAAGSSKLDEAAGGTSNVEHAAAGSSKVDEAANGTSTAHHAAAESSKLDEAAGGTSNVEHAAAGSSKLDEAAGGTSNVEHAAAGSIKAQQTAAGKHLVEPEKDSSSKEGPRGSVALDLHTGARTNSRDVVVALLEKGEPVDALNYDGETPLAVAVKNDFPPIVDVLLKNKADIRKENREGDSYVHVAAACQKPASLRMLLENGAPVDSLNWRGERPLAVAVKKNDPEIIKILVQYKADVKRETGGGTYLHQAVEEQCLNSLRALLECGAPPDLKDSMGDTPIMLAIEKDDTESAAVLLEFGARLDQGWRGGNLLHCAACWGSPACIELLVRRGLDVDAVNDNGWTPLHCAAANGRLDAARMLLNLDSRLDIVDRKGRTPLRIAQFFKHTAVADFLRSVGGRV